jgi:hypothetical protein
MATEPVYKVYDTPEDKVRSLDAWIRAAEDQLNEHKPQAEKRIQRYRGEYVTDYTVAEGHQVNVPVGTGNIDAMYSSLTAIDVSTIVEPGGNAGRLQAQVAEAGINEVFREAKVSHKAGYAIKDALIVGIGWLKVGYDYFDQEVDVPRSDEAIAADVDKVFEEAENAGMAPPDPESVSQLIPTHEKAVEVVRDRIVVDYVPWDEMLWTPEARKVEDIRRIGQRLRVPVHEVRTNPHFEAYCKEAGTLKKLREREGDSTLDREDDSRIDLAKEDEESEYLTLYEVCDFETGTICTKAKGADFLLNEQPNPLNIHDDLEDKNPYVALILREDPMNVWGIGDMELMENSLDELNLARTNLLNYLERFVPKVIGPAEAFGEGGKRAMKSREWGEYVGLEGASANEVKVLEPPPLLQEMFDLPNRISNDIRESTGVNELMRGIFPDRKRTATETNEVVAASSARQSEKRNRLEKFYVDIAKRILFYMQLFYDDTRIAKLMTVEGEVDWAYNGEDIIMEADLVVHLQPKEAVTSEVRAERALMMFNYLGEMPEVDRKRLIKVVLEESGVPPATVSYILKDDEAMQKDQMQAAQEAAAMAQAEQGVVPDPAMIPGPVAGDALMAEANAGEVPPEALIGIAGAAPGTGEGDLPLLGETELTMNE